MDGHGAWCLTAQKRRRFGLAEAKLAGPGPKHAKVPVRAADDTVLVIEASAESVEVRGWNHLPGDKVQLIVDRFDNLGVPSRPRPPRGSFQPRQVVDRASVLERAEEPGDCAQLDARAEYL